MATNLTIDTNLNIPRNSPSPRPPTPYVFQPQGKSVTVPLVLSFIGPKAYFINDLTWSNDWTEKTKISLHPDTTTYKSFMKGLEFLMIDVGMPCHPDQVTERITAESEDGFWSKKVVEVKSEKWQGIMEDVREGKLKEFKLVCEMRKK